MEFFTAGELTKLSNKQFLEDIAEYADTQRSLIEAEVGGFSSDPIIRAARIKRAQNDLGFFAKEYFPHYVTTGRSVFHNYVFDDVPALIDAPESAKEAVAAPRGEAKTTLLTQILQIWCVVTNRKHFGIIIMDALEQSAMMLEAIKVELEFNPRLIQDFPKATGQGKQWQSAKVVTANNVLLLAAGAGKKLRGLRHGPHRPDLISLDDIENDKNVKNPDLRDELEKWINSSILKLKGAGRKMDVFYVGTILHYDSVLSRIMSHPRWRSHRFQAIIEWPDRMDLWDKWEEVLLNDGQDKAAEFYRKRKTKMDAGAVVSWPEARDLYTLMLERSDSHTAFEQELQNDPSDSENAIFKELQYWVHTSAWVFYGSCDPSLGKKGKSTDPSAILIGGWNKKNGVLDIVEASIAKRVPLMIMQKCIDFQREYNCILWAFEAVQFQEFCRTQLLAMSIAQSMPVPASPVIPSTDKLLRIESISPFVVNGNIRSHLRHKVLNQQLLHFPQARNDDGPDALEMLWTLASRNSAGTPSVLSGGGQSHFKGYN